jgi:hypothetical protein
MWKYINELGNIFPLLIDMFVDFLLMFESPKGGVSDANCKDKFYFSKRTLMTFTLEVQTPEYEQEPREKPILST